MPFSDSGWVALILYDIQYEKEAEHFCNASKLKTCYSYPLSTKTLASYDVDIAGDTAEIGNPLRRKTNTQEQEM